MWRPTYQALLLLLLLTSLPAVLLLPNSSPGRPKNSTGPGVLSPQTFEEVPSLSSMEPWQAESTLRSQQMDYHSSFTCTLCRLAGDVLVEFQRRKEPEQSFINFASTLCHFFKIESKDVCKGMVTEYGQALFTILKQANGTISSTDICAMMSPASCEKYSKRMNSWSLDIPDLERRSPVLPPVWPKSEDVPKQKILHLSDPHVQLDYKIGSNTQCSKPLCCSADDGPAPAGTAGASSMGDYSCDLPPWTFDAIVKTIKTEHPDLDYIFLTGDYPAHDVWKQNRTANANSAHLVVEVMSKYFPDTPVFPALGNHESYPVNLFPSVNQTGKYNPSWLYATLASYYKKWLPGKDQQRTLIDGAYYTILLRPGLRLISINTNNCNNFNLWLLLNIEDPSQHLHWIYRTLHKAELNKEKVFLIGHISPGQDDCLSQWSHEFNRIVRRFNNTILAQFFGHTHQDEFSVFFGDKKHGREPVNIAYLAPSLTPYHGVNPGYRVYEIDGSHPATSNLVLDHSSFWFDLPASIRSRSLVHRPEYSARQAYGLDDLSPASWRQLVHKMATDDAKWASFYAFTFRHGPRAGDKCDKTCRKKILCQLLTSEAGNRENCDVLDRLMEPPSRNSASFWDFLWG